MLSAYYSGKGFRMSLGNIPNVEVRRFPVTTFMLRAFHTPCGGELHGSAEQGPRHRCDKCGTNIFIENARFPSLAHEEAGESTA